MNWRTPLLVLALLAPIPARSDIGNATPAAASQACRQAIAMAERAYHIPSHLLAAVARVESGRRDQASGGFNPWPWTINRGGAGSFYDNKTQAVATATAMRPRVTKSIDVGCMQISLTHHPDAFPNMDTAFDPNANVTYGARLLTQLFEKTGSWPRAVELYHSGTPELGQEYRVRVYAAWPEEQKLAQNQPLSPLANAWASTVNRALLSAPLRPASPRIIRQSAESTPGLTLQAYRATPVRTAFQAP